MFSLTVEAADDLLANSRLFRWIGGVHHAFCQTGYLVSGQLSLRVKLISKSNDAELLLWIEPLDFFNDLTRGHISILSRPLSTLTCHAVASREGGSLHF